MPVDPTVLAVCVNWNGAEVLPATLEALRRSSYPRLRLLVVDNASSDDSASVLKEGIRLLRLDHNRGYAAAINAAVFPAGPGKEPSEENDRADFLFLLNNDVTVDRDAVTNLVRCAQKVGPGIFGPKVLRADRPDRLEAAWGKLTWNHVLARFYGKNAFDSDRWNTHRRVGLVLGSALLVDRRVFDTVGTWDEQFFLYHEEIDFEYRASLHGFPVYYCPSARVFHRGAHGTRSEPLRKTFWVRRNAVLFLRKHRAGLLHRLRFGLTLTASLLTHLLLFRWERVWVILQAVREGMQMECRRG